MTRHAASWRAAAASVAGVMLAAAVASGCGTAAGPSPSASAAASSPPVTSPAGPTPLAGAAFTEADLDRIVLGEADAPGGATYLGTDVGPDVLINPVWYLSSSDQQRFRDLPGFVDAAASSFRLGTSSADPLFVSEVMLFDDADSAAQAMAAYAQEWQSSFGFDDPTPSTVEFGEEGLLFSGPAAVQNGEPGVYYFWRVDNLLLNMVAVGPVEGAELEAMESTVRAMALEMDRRASPPGSDTAQDCSASADWQLAYEVPGMDDVEVTCDVVYKQIAGVDATLDLYLPPDVGDGAALPAVVFVHGNGDNPELRPIEEHWKRDQYTAARVVAALGFAAISFDYRGYDLPARLAEAERDVIDLLAYVRANAAHLHVDPVRICLWSVSGGGLPAAWASSFGDPQAICTVLISAGFAGAPPDADPVAAMTGDMPPVFLARGARDGYADPTRFLDAAVPAGVEVTVEQHPGGHGFESTVDAEQQRIVGLALDFVSEHLED